MRTGPNISSQGAAPGRRVAGSDGPWLPGAATVTPCQAAAAPFFNAITAAFNALLIVTWRSGAGLQTTWRYEHPAHHPSRPKLVQSPLPPTLMELYRMPPFLMRSAKDIIACAALKASTACLHPAGMAVLIVGLARAGAKPDSIGAFAGAVPPRNLASGHLSIMSMAQSYTKRATAAPRVDLRAGARDDHHSHERKNCRAL